MAAILQPHRLPELGATTSPRPPLRLVAGEQARHRVDPRRAAQRRSLVVIVVAAVVAAVAAMALAVAVGRGSFAALAPAPPAAAGAAGLAAGGADGPAGRTVVAEPGDTLWSIARRVQPEGDVRPLVDRLVAAHGSTVVVPGERIVVPG